MFTGEPNKYLVTFKDFLLAQQSAKADPIAAVLIAEIERELLRRI
jgi:hypothetical protein